MLGRLSLVALVAAAAFAPAASAQGGCAAPDRPGTWHSCLTASHRAADDGTGVHLTSVRPRLAVRYEDGCPKGADRRTVVIRADGKLLVRARVNSRCKRGVARYGVVLRLDVDAREGTVVRSFWSRIADGETAPKVRL